MGTPEAGRPLVDTKLKESRELFKRAEDEFADNLPDYRRIQLVMERIRTEIEDFREDLAGGNIEAAKAAIPGFEAAVEELAKEGERFLGHVGAARKMVEALKRLP